MGKIPEDWRAARLVDVADYINGYAFSPEDWKSEGLPIIRIQNLNDPNVEFNHFDGEIDDRYIVEDGDLLFAWSASIGVYIWNRGRAVLNQHIFKVIPKEKIDRHFLYYALFVGTEQLKNRVHGSTMKHFKRGELKIAYVPLPPVEEQEGIVGVLGVVDSAIGLVDRVIWKTERLKKGLMQTLLTKGIGHTEYKDTPIGKTPKEWDIKRLEEASKEVTIGVVNPATPYYTSANDGVPYFRSQNVRENRLEPTNVYVRPEFNERHPKSILKENDILTLQTGFIGVSCIVPKEYEGTNCHSLLITRTDPKMLNPRFLCQFLNSAVGKKIINRHNSGWGRAHLLLEDFRRISIPLPPLQEQQTIAEILSTIDKRIELERKEKTRLERIKRGLMDLLLTGKVRVKVD